MRIVGPARALCVMLAVLVLIQTWPIPVSAQEPESTKLTISVLEGEGAINNIHQRVAREAMVQVQDVNHKPVAGAAVTFFLPENGASGVFSNGTRTLTVMTDDTGRAVARGMVPNKVPGQVEVRVVAKFKTLTGETIIHQQNVAAALAAGATAGAISGKVLAIILATAAAGVAGGVVAATHTGGGGSSPVIITPGTPTVGAPH